MSHLCLLAVRGTRGARGRALASCALVLALGAAAQAGTVTGRLDFPPPEKREPSATRGYLDPVDNAILPVQTYSPAPEMVVVLEGASAPEGQTLPRVVYELRGESFARPVIAVQKGQEVEIKNASLAPRNLVVKEDPSLLTKGTLNVTGVRSFRIAEAGKVYTLVDANAPHLIGRIVAVATPYRAYPDKEGRFSFENVAEGQYKLRVFYRDKWLEAETGVSVPGGSRAKVETRLPIPTGYRLTK